MQEKLKGFLADEGIYTAILLVLIAVVSFGLGRRSVSVEAPLSQPAGVVFSKPANFQPIKSDDSENIVVASKSGTKYHLLSCPGVGQIKEENKLFFNSVTEAKAAGYSAAANCPELKNI